MELLKGVFEVSGCSLWSAGLGKPVTISPSRLSTLPFVILVLLDRLRGALGVTGPVTSSETGKSVVLPLSLHSILPFGILVLLDRLRGALSVTGPVMSSEKGKTFF